MFAAIRLTWPTECCHRQGLRNNLLAGLTVGIIALPLSMALAIASGVPPQHGLYTAAIGGVVIALTGGSRVNISGPTAAFVVVLLPIVQHYGLGGLLVSGLMAGVILILLGVGRLGNLIEVVPYPVTIGFTSGIGLVIASLQIKDFLGLDVPTLSGHFVDKVLAIGLALPTWQWTEATVGGLTLMTLLLWPRTGLRIPAHLVALLVGTMAALLMAPLGGDFVVDTIGSRFSYQDHTGQIVAGIPALLPSFSLPWQQPGPGGLPLGLSWTLIQELTGAAFSIAILGAIESLLCAAVADGMTGQKHDPNDELIGQGIGNLVVPFFGGVPATAALARTTANIRAGATWPLASIVHGLFILLAIVALAPYLAYIPMAAMAALLLVVAWNMSEGKHFLRMLRIAPRPDRLTLLTCFGLTVLFDMAIAVAAGMLLAAMLFVHRISQLTNSTLIGPGTKTEPHAESLPDGVLLYDINGPLFFGTARKALTEITRMTPGIKVIILDMSDVPMLDATAMVAMESLVVQLRARRIGLVINHLAPRMILKLRRIGLRSSQDGIDYARDLNEAIRIATEQMAAQKPALHA